MQIKVNKKTQPGLTSPTGVFVDEDGDLVIHSGDHWAAVYSSGDPQVFIMTTNPCRNHLTPVRILSIEVEKI